MGVMVLSDGERKLGSIMVKVFEDEFSVLQSDLISLCLEVSEGKADKIFAYTSIEGKSKMFNAFFKINGTIKALNQLGKDNQLIMQFLRIGTGDLEKIFDICNKYNMPIPTEMKMRYEAKSGNFGSEYKYEEICSAKTGVSAAAVFLDCLSEIKQQENHVH